MNKKLGIIILNWNGSEDTISCLKSLKEKDMYDVILLDNNSKEEEYNILEHYISEYYVDSCIIKNDKNLNLSAVSASLILVRSEVNLGFANGNNFIANQIIKKYEYVLLLNNDTEVETGAIGNMLSLIAGGDYVAVTCDIRMYFDKSRLWNAGGMFTWYNDRRYIPQKKIDKLEKSGVKSITVDFITGCALMIRSSHIEKYGLFTTKFFHGEEDFNLCYRLRKLGYKVGVDLTSRIYHKVGRSVNKVVDENRIANGIVLHFSNRVIDFKDFLPNYEWIVWREIFLFLIFIRQILSKRGFACAMKIVNRIRYISTSYNEVDRDLFKKITTGEI